MYNYNDYVYITIIYVLCSQFKIDGKWHTWIDFDKFIELVS